MPCGNGLNTKCTGKPKKLLSAAEALGNMGNGHRGGAIPALFPWDSCIPFATAGIYMSVILDSP